MIAINLDSTRQPVQQLSPAHAVYPDQVEEAQSHQSDTPASREAAAVTAPKGLETEYAAGRYRFLSFGQFHLNDVSIDGRAVRLSEVGEPIEVLRAPFLVEAAGHNPVRVTKNSGLVELSSDLLLVFQRPSIRSAVRDVYLMDAIVSLPVTTRGIIVDYVSDGALSVGIAWDAYETEARKQAPTLSLYTALHELYRASIASRLKGCYTCELDWPDVPLAQAKVAVSCKHDSQNWRWEFWPDPSPVRRPGRSVTVPWGSLRIQDFPSPIHVTAAYSEQSIGPLVVARTYGISAIAADCGCYGRAFVAADATLPDVSLRAEEGLRVQLEAVSELHPTSLRLDWNCVHEDETRMNTKWDGETGITLADGHGCLVLPQKVPYQRDVPWPMPRLMQLAVSAPGCDGQKMLLDGQGRDTVLANLELACGEPDCVLELLPPKEAPDMAMWVDELGLQQLGYVSSTEMVTADRLALFLEDSKLRKANSPPDMIVSIEQQGVALSVAQDGAYKEVPSIVSTVEVEYADVADGDATYLGWTWRGIDFVLGHATTNREGETVTWTVKHPSEGATLWWRTNQARAESARPLPLTGGVLHFRIP